MNRVGHDQPKGLYLLFFTELWERFGFYMVQAILIPFLNWMIGSTKGPVPTPRR